MSEAPARGGGSEGKRTVWVGDLGPFMYKDDDFFTSCTTGVRFFCLLENLEADN